MVKMDLPGSDVFLYASAAGATAYSAHLLAKPKHAHETYMLESEPYSEPQTRWNGLACLGVAANTLLIAKCPDEETKKNALRANAGMWAAGAALHAYNVREEKEKKKAGWAQAALHAGMALALLAKSDLIKEKGA